MRRGRNQQHQHKDKTRNSHDRDPRLHGGATPTPGAQNGSAMFQTRTVSIVGRREP
jgi:hypothetical protein